MIVTHEEFDIVAEGYDAGVRLAGDGITFGMEDTFRPYVEAGQMIPVL